MSTFEFRHGDFCAQYCFAYENLPNLPLSDSAYNNLSQQPKLHYKIHS